MDVIELATIFYFYLKKYLFCFYVIQVLYLYIVIIDNTLCRLHCLEFIFLSYFVIYVSLDFQILLLFIFFQIFTYIPLLQKVDLICKYKDLMENLIKLIDISSYYLPQSYKYFREYFEIYLFSISLCFLKVIYIELFIPFNYRFTYFSALSYLVLSFYHDCIILSICL